uniref:Uncharacterized protein n=1 Tax=Picea glauca TaxID=3330 RepID=A0A101M2V4_PICGL|nr:hypothetical protein ABT39_MTgene3264 [Picea glauca]QHR89235.1 hypothetical protein Q903MT_gene3255 [Picea sitchensis]
MTRPGWKTRSISVRSRGSNTRDGGRGMPIKRLGRSRSIPRFRFSSSKFYTIFGRYNAAIIYVIMHFHPRPDMALAQYVLRVSMANHYLRACGLV